MNSTEKVIARYAPSPTGDLHLGNLRTALLAWLHCRLQDGRFLLRMEDLDTPRVVAGSAEQILRDLEWLGVDWDGEVVYQSQRHELYQNALQLLDSKDLLYPCFCSRKDIQQALSAPHQVLSVYPKTCAELTSAEVVKKEADKTPALRLRVSEQCIRFADGFMAQQQQDLAKQCGDFVIKRADGLFAYQLAVVVDDIEQGINHVLRGVDLLDSTARQIYLAQLLAPEKPSIQYWHVPLMLVNNGQKMSKRDGSYSIKEWLIETEDRKLDKQNVVSQLIGYLAYSSGLIDKNTALSAAELLAALDYSQFVRAVKEKC